MVEDRTAFAAALAANDRRKPSKDAPAVTSSPNGPAASPATGPGTSPVREDPEHATQPAGPRGDNPATAGPGPTQVQSNTPENSPGRLNPSAPEDANTTPGTTSDN